MPYHKLIESELVEEEYDEYEETEYVIQSKTLEEPKDSYYIVYATFCIFGIAALLSNSFFTIANRYFMYKLRDVTRNDIHHMNNLQVSYTSYVAVVTSIPFPIFCIINVFINDKISCQKRIITSLIIIFVLFIVTTVLVKINTDSCTEFWYYSKFTGQKGFLAVTLCSVALMSSASAIFMSTFSGIVSKFSPKYITSFVLGQSLSGTFSSLAQVISLAIGTSPTVNGLIYFVIGSVTVVVAVILYIFLQKNVFYGYFLMRENEIGISEFEKDLRGIPKVSYKIVFKKIWQYCICSSLVVCITWSIQPGLSVLIQSYEHGIWNDIYFNPVITFLLSNVVDCLGRILSGITQWPKNKTVLLLLNLLRIGFIPIIMYCNLQPRGNLPVVFDNDAYYIIFNSLIGFTSGYLFNISLIDIPNQVEHYEKYTAGLIVSTSVALGVNIGALLSVLFVKII